MIKRATKMLRCSSRTVLTDNTYITFSTLHYAVQVCLSKGHVPLQVGGGDGGGEGAASTAFLANMPAMAVDDNSPEGEAERGQGARYQGNAVDTRDESDKEDDSIGGSSPQNSVDDAGGASVDDGGGERGKAAGTGKECKTLVRNCGLLYEGHTVCKGKKEVMHGQGVYMNSMHTGNMGDAVGTNDFLWQSYKGEFNNDKMSGQGSCGAFFLPPCQSGRLSVRVAAQCELLLLSSPCATRGKLRVVSFASDVPGCRVQGQSHLSMGLYSRAACATTVRSRAF